MISKRKKTFIKFKNTFFSIVKFSLLGVILNEVLLLLLAGIYPTLRYLAFEGAGAANYIIGTLQCDIDVAKLTTFVGA